MNNGEFVSYFKEEFFIPKLKSKKKKAVLEELIQPLVNKKLIKSQKLVFETLLNRETLGSTGIGKQVAIPHCRTLAIPEICIVVGVSEVGIEFNASDGKDVQLFFLILGPPLDESNQYLPILGKLCERLRKKTFKDKLVKAESYEKFIKLLAKG
ncbi:PTS sugar transporter subunit IIA [candidate division KSB1 bacterium]|nr:PTS sugar transporter subunit IIA [candidate division KSB1 bacterium]